MKQNQFKGYIKFYNSYLKLKVLISFKIINFIKLLIIK
jgi:hypothetical protein